LAGTRELEGTAVWPLDLKNSRKLVRMSLLVIMGNIMRPQPVSPKREPGFQAGNPV
jgi:hypothetical protein